MRTFLLALIPILMWSLPASAGPNTCSDDAQEYWKTFRAAVLHKDVSAVANSSRFPFELRQTLDDSPARQIRRDEFMRIFPTLLESDAGVSAKPSAMKDHVRANAQLSASSCNAQQNQFSVGTWTFQRTTEGWKFVQAFMDE